MFDKNNFLEKWKPWKLYGIVPMVDIDEQINIDYGVDAANGEIYSFKYGRMRKKKINYNRGKAPQNVKRNYARFGITMHGKDLNKFVHRVVAETLTFWGLMPLPLDKNHPPAGVSVEDWAAAGEAGQRVIKQSLFVDHIDNNPMNYHPTNLRWTTAKQNAIFYQNEQKYIGKEIATLPV